VIRPGSFARPARTEQQRPPPAIRGALEPCFAGRSFGRPREPRRSGLCVHACHVRAGQAAGSSGRRVQALARTPHSGLTVRGQPPGPRCRYYRCMKRPRHRSRGASVFALALFLAGTNYCLVGGVASHFGARMSCMAPATAPGSCHAAPASTHCAQAGAPAQGSSHNGPVRTATPPCCVALAPVLAAPGVEIPAGALALALPVPPAADEAAPLLASWLGYRVTRDAGPPALHPRAPLSARAPPLA